MVTCAKAVKGEGSLETQGKKGVEWRGAPLGGSLVSERESGPTEAREEGRGQRIQGHVNDGKARFGT